MPIDGIESSMVPGADTDRGCPKCGHSERYRDTTGGDSDVVDAVPG